MLEPCLSDRSDARVARRDVATRPVERTRVDACRVGEATDGVDVVAPAWHGAALEVAEPCDGALAVDVEAAALVADDAVGASAEEARVVSPLVARQPRWSR